MELNRFEPVRLRTCDHSINPFSIKMMKEIMDSKDLDELAGKIKEKQEITQEYLEKLLLFPDMMKLADNLDCRFLLIKNDGNDVRERDFLKMIIQNIVIFVMKYEEYQNISGLDAVQILRQNSDLLLKAKSKFLTKNEKTGEPGELILFLLLESQKITQIVSKMKLKQSTEWPVLGLDAIHLEVREGRLIFHYGEAKMYQDFNQGLTSAIDSIESFDGKQEDVEIDLIKSNIDESKFGDSREKILEVLDPYFENKENIEKKHSVFLGFDWNLLSDLSNRKGNELTKYLSEEYYKSQKNLVGKIGEKVSNSKVKNRDFSFFVLPFKSVIEFRKSFLGMIGSGE